MMKYFLIILCTITAPVMACDTLPIYGHYHSVTESHCNMYVVLEKGGTGYADETCTSSEAGDLEKTYKLEWESKNNKVLIKAKEGIAIFRYVKCHSHSSYGSSHKSDAIILIEGELFNSYRELWR